MDKTKPKIRPQQMTSLYQRTDVLTANRQTILLMLYAGAIRFLKSAIEEGHKGNDRERTRMILQTQSIIGELRATLNFDASREIASQLESLYAFITRSLLDATQNKKEEPLRNVLAILCTLNEAWEQAIASLKK